MPGVLQDREAEMELGYQRPGRAEWVDGHGDNPTPEPLDLSEAGLQLHELRLARPSARPFVEVEHDFGSAQLR